MSRLNRQQFGEIRKNIRKHNYSKRYVYMFWCSACLLVAVYHVFAAIYFPLMIYSGHQKTHVIKITHAKNFDKEHFISGYSSLHLVEFSNKNKELIAFPELVKYQENVTIFWSPKYKAALVMQNKETPVFYDFFLRSEGIKALFLKLFFCSLLIYGIAWNIKMLRQEKQHALSSRV